MAYEYSDCWVDDARLVVLNARDAAQKGAQILTRTQAIRAEVQDGLWCVTLRDHDGDRSVTARTLINAGGPWAEEIVKGVVRIEPKGHVRLVRGSHIVTRMLFEHDKAYFLQGTDGRIIFAIPYEQDFTLIGTTDADHAAPDLEPQCSDAERDYLLNFANQYFRESLSAEDVIWTFSGVRPLYDDGARSATAATRDYVLTLNTDAGAPMLSVYGGKITTYRRLAEAALAKLATVLPMRGAWTAGVALPGGDFAHDGVAALTKELMHAYSFLDQAWATRLIRAYGTEARAMLGDAASREDLGQDFGATLTAREVNWLCEREFAQSAEDILWRRSKLGLRMSDAETNALRDYLAATRPAA